MEAKKVNSSMGETATNRNIQNGCRQKEAQTIRSAHSSVARSQYIHQPSAKNLLARPKLKRNALKKLNNCTVSENTAYVTYLYVSGQKLTEHPEKIHYLD
jgi:hypothetical protein